MRVLAVDTSSSVAAVAVLDEKELLGEYILNHKKTHSQKLVPMIDQILSSLELKTEDIDIFAAATGPGSFTGLRIGITTIKAMAFALKKPVVGIPSLDALAHNIQAGDTLICPIMDARNDQVFTALYRNNGTEQMKMTEYLGVEIHELIQLIKGKNMKVIFNGDGVFVHEKLLKTELGENCSFAPLSHMLHRASSVAQLALLEAASRRTENCMDMVPFYLRKPQAERELEKKHKEKMSEQV